MGHRQCDVTQPQDLGRVATGKSFRSIAQTGIAGENGVRYALVVNDLNEVAGRMFTRLAHEAFHAYLETYVYPRQVYDVPRWLNEGLAQTFEVGLLESDSLRIDTPNAVALAQLQSDLRSARPLELSELLGAGSNTFLSAHTSAGEAASRWKPARAAEIEPLVVCSSFGSGPTKSMPGMGKSSVICCTPISASPRATKCPTRWPSSGVTPLALT